MAIKYQIEKSAIRHAFSYIQKNPGENMKKLMSIADRAAGEGLGSFPKQREVFRNIVNDPENNYNKLLVRAFNDLDSQVLETVFTNFIMNANILGWRIQQENREKYGCNIPWAILLDPTSACNLHCTGCWAAEYGSKLNLSFDDIDDIIRQGKELGVYLYIYTGGEPLVRKADIIRLCEKHPDCVFLTFTNATLIDEKFADDMLRLKNFIPAISVEGFESSTDSRRGSGTFGRVMAAMKLLKDRGLPFGISCCYTANNISDISSDEYFDAMIDWGAYFIWYFHYMPVGSDAVPELLPSPEQREFMYRRVRKLRAEKPLFAMDFQNDGEFVQGCIAGGRRYLHINANGDVDPCVFIHYSDSNIHEKTLLEALRSPLFMAYHDGQPFNGNHLRPCPMLENPEILCQIVNSTGAHSTDPQSPESVEHLCGKCRSYAENWKPAAERIWANEPHSTAPFSR